MFTQGFLPTVAPTQMMMMNQMNQMSQVNQMQQQMLLQQQLALLAVQQQQQQQQIALEGLSSSSNAEGSSCGSSTAGSSSQAHNDILKVSGTTKINGLAGAIAKRLRLDSEVVIEAMGAESVATAVQGLCVSRMFIMEMGKYFLIKVESLRSADGPGIRLIAMRAKKSVKLLCEDVSYTSLRKVNKASKVSAVAGSLAKTLRTSDTNDILGLDIPLTAELLNTGLKSIALSRLMVQNDGIDLYIAPYFSGEENVQIAIYKQKNVNVVKCLADTPSEDEVMTPPVAVGNQPVVLLYQMPMTV
eukprot:TRINITY_DN2380_c0_g1_i6.p1 TRINITY_DN2380_c0_g1~~TRINITY_DN2380_c0_g1_i6.p1  ORF type:complete len:301 (+),score=64.26 TRINITY_DN2380_c0_g1_i6:65-967(+)